MLKPREVADYLRDHPEFLAEHPHLFTAPTPPRAARAGSASEPVHARIHERRERTLREREDRQQARLEQILDTARSNQDLARGLHQVAVSLLGLDDLDPGDRGAPGLLVKSRFDVDDAAIFLSSRERDFPPRVEYAALRQRVAHLGSVCDDRVSGKLGAALFPDAAAVASCAFIPIAHRQTLYGVMVLGSADRERFRPDMGVLILDRLGQLIGAYLAGRGLV